MCTVTYLPTPDGFILTHNRDEAPARSPRGIERVTNKHDTLLFPRDTRAGGAWIVTGRRGRTACLLNGAFEKHRHEPPYRRSRGLVLLDFYTYDRPADFFERYDLDGIEPFTFLYFAENGPLELRWDGARRHLTQLPPDKPHFWCSSTLYPPAMQELRERVFQSWLLLRPVPGYITPAEVAQLHRTGSVGDSENDFVMNRDGRVQTVSITQVVRYGKRLRMQYWDLLEGRHDVRSCSIRPEILSSGATI